MAEIDENITQEAIDEATTQNRAVLQERFPDYDISVGGLIDGIIVNGAVAVAAQNNANIDNALLITQLKAISEGTVEVDDEALDDLMAAYFLIRNEEVAAYGTVVFVVRDNRNYTLQSGYRLRTSDQTYQLTQTYNIYPVGTTGVDFTEPTNVEIQQVYDLETGYGFRFELPIESLEATPLAVLVSGDRLTVDQGFDGLGYVEANTNFQGGVAEETNQEFATRGLLGLLSATTSGQSQIEKIVQDTVQLATSSSVGVNDALMSRDRDNVFNLSTGGKLDVYVKVGAVAQSGYIVTAEVINTVARTIKITLTREQSAGVYTVDLSPIYTATPPALVSGSVAIQSISHNIWTDTDVGAFNPELPDEYDRAFSARQQIEIIAVDDRQDGGGYVVTMSAPGDLIENTYIVSTDYQPQVLELDDALTSAEYRPPGADVLVKAAPPCLTTIGVTARIPTDYNGPSAASLEKSLASLVNALPINTEFLDGFVISNLLKEISSQLSLDAVSLAGTIYGQDDSTIAVSQLAGRLTIPTNTVAKIAPYNTYFATTSDLVTVSLV